LVQEKLAWMITEILEADNCWRCTVRVSEYEGREEVDPGAHLDWLEWTNNVANWLLKRRARRADILGADGLIVTDLLHHGT